MKNMYTYSVILLLYSSLASAMHNTITIRVKLLDPVSHNRSFYARSIVEEIEQEKKKREAQKREILFTSDKRSHKDVKIDFSFPLYLDENQSKKLISLMKLAKL